MIDKLLLEAINSWHKEIDEINDVQQWIADISINKELTDKITKKKNLIDEANKIIKNC